MALVWSSPGDLPSRRYTCGHCGAQIASHQGWSARSANGGAAVAFVYICHLCRKPTYFEINGAQVPGTKFGNSVADIPDMGVESLYDEARRCTGAGAYTAAVLACRKLLMHIAVSKGALPGEPFITYVEYLSAQNYIPPDARSWVDHIRTKANEANHEIVIMPQADAHELLTFIEMLLRVIFEFPAAIRKKTQPKAP